MENSDSGDELSQGFLNDDQQYMLTAVEEMIEPEDHTDDSTHDIFKNNLPLREQDRFLPIANIAKIMKRAIPENGKIAKDARECIQECVSEFISFVTSEASDRCHLEKRKTINGEDILYAMTALGFDNYVEPLKLYLQKYRELAASTSTRADKSLSDNIVFEEDVLNTHYKNSSHVIAQDSQQNETVIYTTYPGEYHLS